MPDGRKTLRPALLLDRSKLGKAKKKFKTFRRFVMPDGRKGTLPPDELIKREKAKRKQIREKTKKIKPRNLWNGRKFSLTPEIQESICGYLREGVTLKAASYLSGVNPDTSRTWLQRAKGHMKETNPDLPSQGICEAFLAATEEALSDFQRIHLESIRRAALAEGASKIVKTRGGETVVLTKVPRWDPRKKRMVILTKEVVTKEPDKLQEIIEGQWPASAWLLEHRFPKEWALRIPEGRDEEERAGRLDELLSTLRAGHEDAPPPPQKPDEEVA